MSLSRRKFFALAGASAAGAFMVSSLETFYSKSARGQSTTGRGYGSLTPKLPTNTELLAPRYRGVNFLELPEGFEYTAFSITGDPMSDGTPVPGAHDGMATFEGPRGSIILVRNHELSPNSGTTVTAPESQRYDSLCRGGTTTLVVDQNGNLIRHFGSLAGTYRNCAGGPSPWGSWISCEENTSTPAQNQPGGANNVSQLHGYNFEVPATGSGLVIPEPLVAMGRFNHEAVAFDPKTGFVYQTEDQGSSSFYRFRPNESGNLKAGGILEALVIEGAPADTRRGYLGRKGQPLSVNWVIIDDVNPAQDTLRLEAQTKGAAIFSRGEGAFYGNNLVYFTCTSGGDAGRGQVFAYDPANNTITLVVESESQSELDSPDNIVVAPNGDLYLCEDGAGEQFVVGVNRQGELFQFARNALNDSEFAGACFSPDGTKMFVNIQTPGITLCIQGPW